MQRFGLYTGDTLADVVEDNDGDFVRFVDAAEQLGTLPRQTAATTTTKRLSEAARHRSRGCSSTCSHMPT